jgi:hypothetical protein
MACVPAVGREFARIAELVAGEVERNGAYTYAVAAVAVVAVSVLVRSVCSLLSHQAAALRTGKPGACSRPGLRNSSGSF